MQYVTETGLDVVELGLFCGGEKHLNCWVEDIKPRLPKKGFGKVMTCEKGLVRVHLDWDKRSIVGDEPKSGRALHIQVG